MSEVLTEFIRALRAADVRVSISESIDAGRAVELVGFDNRQVLKHSLGQVLAKTEEEKLSFDETFDKFFAFDQFKPPPKREDGPGQAKDGEGEGEESESGQDAPSDGEGGEEGGSPSMPGQSSGGDGGAPQGAQSGGKPGGGPVNEGGVRQAGPNAPGGQNLLEMLEAGDAAALQMALAEAARRTQLNRIRLFTQRGMYVRRILEEMGLETLDQAIEAAERQGTEAGDARGQEIREMRDGLRAQVRDYVEQQLELYTANAGKRLREEVLSQVRLSNVDHRDAKVIRQLVKKMAKKLIALNSRRKKRTLRGQLDVRKTIRKNIEYDGLLFDIVWKSEKVDRPKVMAICDVSGSVAQYTRFLLMFLYSLSEVLPQVRAFAFSGRLGEVTDLFEKEGIEKAIAETMHVHGGGATDYGMALEDFADLALDDVDHHTTVIMLGDGRSNNANPRADILDKIHDRARRVIWLNPEPKSLWNTGDSVMRSFTPHCDRAQTCASLKDLERVVSELLRTAV